MSHNTGQNSKISPLNIRLCPCLPGKKQQTIADHKYLTMDSNIFKNDQDYWLIADNIRDIYLSDGSLSTLLDFERVLDELDIYAFKNWQLGELVSGPDIGKYKVGCIFMWPGELMPDPRGARRLLPFDCEVRFKKTRMKVPKKIEKPTDFRPGTHKAKLIDKPVWLVEIVMPKNLMNDIRTGAVELEDETIDLEELDQAYEQDLDQEQYQDQGAVQQAQATLAPSGGIPNVV